MDFEKARLAALRAYQVLDTPPDPTLDKITALAAELFEVPSAAISLIDADRQWFKSRFGELPPQTPRAHAFCDHTVRLPPGETLLVSDARLEPAFRDNPLVTAQGGIRFYLGAPLVDRGGHALGALCVIDTRPRHDLGPRDRRRLQVLAGLVVDELELGHAARQVRETTRLLTLAEAMAGVGHWRFHLDGRMSWSDEVYRIHGVDRATFDPNPKNALNFFMPEDKARVAEAVARAVADRSGYELELDIRRSDGAVRRVVTRAACELDAGGKPVALFGVFQDITDQHDLLGQVSAERERYRLLADNANDMISTSSMDSTILFVTPGVRRVLGYEPEEIVGRKTLDLTHPEDLPGVMALFKALVAAGPDAPPAPYQFRGRRKDGAWAWLEGQPRVQRDAAGAPIAFQDVVRDITARKTAEDAAREAALASERLRTLAAESERRYRLLADNATDMIARYGLDGAISFVSPASLSVLGFSPEELLGRKTIEFIHPDDLVRVRQQFADYVASGSTAAMRTRHRVRRKNGQVVWLEGRPLLVRSAEDEPLEFYDVMRDVTDRVQLERELVEAKIAAEAASRAKSDFLANMSHELRTPLNSIIGFTHVLVRDESLGEGHRHQLLRVEEAGRGLLTVVNDVLDFSKIEQEGVKLSPRPFSPVRLMENLVALVHPQATDKALSLVVDYPLDRQVLATGDVDRLRQVLMNLLSNALKFTRKGEVRLALQTRRRDGRVQLTFQVSDTGIGLAADQIEGLFQRFAQADGSISRRFGGTGLGLAISKRLVEAMEGSIEVWSEPGRGATFEVRVNLPEAEALGEGDAALFVTAAAPGVAAAAGVKVLVAEDVPVNQELVRLMLGPLGCEVVVVDNGEQAVDAVGAGDFHLILMDMQMPVLDGLEATRMIRRLGGRAARTPIVALSANVLPEQIELCRRAGMDDHIAKPFVTEDLQSAVLKWAEGRGGPTPALMTPNAVLDDLTAQIGAGPIRGLLASLDAQMAQVAALAADGDPGDLSRLAHSLRGAAGALGYGDAARACQAVEAAHRGGGATREAFAALQSACAEARQAVEERLAA